MTNPAQNTRTEYRVWWSNGSHGQTADPESYIVWGRSVGFEPVSVEARDITDWREVPLPGTSEETRGWDINRDCALTGAPLDSCSCDDCTDRRAAPDQEGHDG